MSEIVVHQLDAIHPAIGGTDGFITDMVKNAPPGVDFRIVGVTSGRSGVPLGVWREVALGAARVPFMAVAHVDLRERRSLPHSLRLIRGLVRFRPALDGARIHAHRCDVGLAVSFLYPRSRIALFVHENRKEALGRRHETYWRFFPAGYSAVERLAVARADQVVVMNHDASERLGRLSPQVVYGRNWFDGAVFHPNGNGTPRGCIGWVGRLEEAKDPALAIDTFCRLKELGRPFRAWLAGSGSLFDEIRAQVASTGLTEEVELLGELTPAELADRLRETSVLLITSHSEGLPRAAVEALGCGTPVVSTRCGDLTRLITDDNGRLLASRDPRALAEAVWDVEDSVSRSQTASSVGDYEMRVVLDGLFRRLELASVQPREHRRRLVVVSYLAHHPVQPRGPRTRAVVRELARTHSVELVAGPDHRQATSTRRWPHLRRLAGWMLGAVLIDMIEPWSRRRLRDWQPNAEGALLIGYPFSTIMLAAARLARRSVPYVVDVGDPIALTAKRPTMRGPALWRARRAEARMWASASGAIVTTDGQRDALRALYPGLPILVRPNGVDAGVATPSAATRRTSGSRTLRLVHFGSLYRSRLDIHPLLRRLAEDGPWTEVELTQFGPDWSRRLARSGAGVKVRVRDAVPWPEALRHAQEFDAALVIGNLDPSQLPSKVVSYLSLPIPRIAVTRDPEGDAIGRYLEDKAGWLVLRPDDARAPELVSSHLRRAWTPTELALPASESWDVASPEAAAFVLDSLAHARG